MKDIFESIDEPVFPVKNILPPQIKELHEDIERIPQEEKETVPEKINPSKVFPQPASETTIKKEKRGFFKTPIFFILLILVFLSIVFYGSYLFIQRMNTKKIEEADKKNEQELKDTLKSRVTVDSTQIKDTAEVITGTQEIKPPENKKEQEPQKTETAKEQEKETKPSEIKKSEITSINNFIVINETNGIYLQIASFKDKNSADKKIESLKSKGINLQVTEADLGTKGKYFRIRAGVFKNIDEAKIAADKLK